MMGAGTLRHARPVLGLALLVLALAGPARAQAPAAEPGWCVQCHLLAGPEGQGLVLGQMAWNGPLAQDDLSSCPGLRRARQELLAAESRLAALSALLPGLQSDRLLTAGLERGLERAVELKRQAQAQPVHSLEEVSARLVHEQVLLAEQVERSLRLQQGLRAEGAFWGLGLMAGLVLLLAWLRGLRRLGRRQAPPLTEGEGEAEGLAPLELVRRGRLP
jgi:hypothetical protein